jgi:acetyltransferase-like isoleucine patch superfamily enzyme
VVTRGIPRAQDDLLAKDLSARQKYSRLVVGRDGWGPLLTYELVQLLSQWVPGALGLALRQALYPWLLGACGRRVVFGQHVVLRHPHKIRIGDDVVIDDNCLIDAKGDSNEGITVGPRTFIGRNTILSCKNGDIVIGEAANIGFNCELFSAARVELGPRALLAAYCYVIGGDHDWKDAGKSVLDQGRVATGVRIGAGAWLGAGVKVLDGTNVGDDAIVGAGAVVNADVPPRAIAVGVPARVVGSRAEKAAE